MSGFFMQRPVFVFHLKKIHSAFFCHVWSAALEIRIMGLSGFAGNLEIHLLFNLKAADMHLSVRRDL